MSGFVGQLFRQYGLTAVYTLLDDLQGLLREFSLSLKARPRELATALPIRSPHGVQSPGEEAGGLATMPTTATNRPGLD